MPTIVVVPQDILAEECGVRREWVSESDKDTLYTCFFMQGWLL